MFLFPKLPTSYSTRLKLLLLLLIIFLPASGIIVSSSSVHRRHEISVAKESISLLVQSLAAQQEQIVSGTMQMLSTLAQLPEVRRLNAEACNKLFRDLNEQYPFYSCIAATTPDGEMFAASVPFRSGGVNLSDQKHVKDAIKTLEFSAGGYLVDSVSRVRSLHYAYPVLDMDKRLVVIVMADFKLDEYGRFVEKLDLPENSAITIADHSGVRLHRYPASNAFPPGDILPDYALKQMMDKLDQGIIERTGQDGVNRIYAFKRLRLGDNAPPYLYISVGFHKDPILQKANMVMFFSLSVMGLLCLIGMLSAWFFIHFAFVKPVNRLVVATQRLGTGDFGVRTGLDHTSDELGRLAGSFDNMASLIQKKHIEREKAEKRLKEYEKVVEGLEEMIAVVDRDYRYLIANSAFLNYRRAEKSQVVGCLVSEVLGKEVFERAIKGELDKCFQGRIVKYEMKYQNPIIGERQLSVSFLPIKEPSGANRAACVLQDITERKTAQEELNRYQKHLEDLVNERTSELATAIEQLSREIEERKKIESRLRESEAKYRTLVEQIPAITYIVAVGDQCTTTYVSPQIESMLGFTEKSNIDCKFRSKTLHPDDRERVLCQLKKLRLDGEPFSSEYRIIDRDGTVKWFRDEARAVNDLSGKPIFLHGIMLDITKGKQIEEDLEQSVAELNNLQCITRKLLQKEELSSAMNAIVEGVVMNIGYDMVLASRYLEKKRILTGFALFPADLEILMNKYLLGNLRKNLWKKKLKYENGQNPILDRVFKGETVTSDSLASFISQWIPSAKARAIQKITGRSGYICLPMQVKGETVGIILAGWNDERHNRERMQRALGRVADQGAIAIKSAELFECIKSQQGELRALTAKLQKVQEAERKKIAQELHDRVGQNLTGISINLGIIRSLLLPECLEKVRSRLADCSGLVGNTMGCIRNIMAELHPPGLAEYGLSVALKHHCDQLFRRTGLKVSMKSTETGDLPNREHEIALFRIAQEALTNSIRHSKAREVTVDLEATENRLILCIVDDGVGFDADSQHSLTDGGKFGLITMRERAEAVGGEFRVESAPGKGTKIVVELRQVAS